MIHSRRRIWVERIALGSTVILFLLLFVQFFRLQVLEYDRWKKTAIGQHYFTVKEAFRRGTFYANTSVHKGGDKIAFAMDVPLYHLYADSKAIPAECRKEIQESVLKAFSPSLKEGQKIGKELQVRSRSRRLVSWISEEQKTLFLVWWRGFAKKHDLALNSLYFVLDFRRFHPMGRLLGQVLHTIRDRRDEATGKAYPTGGLELALNSYLDGSGGLRRLMRSPYNSLETGEVLKAPQHGADVELTVHPVIQAIVEDELEKGVKQFKAKGGMAILVEPKSGHILAMGQYPFFYPDKYSDYFNDPLLAERSKITTLTDAREPGSPMKAMTVALALQANRERKAAGLSPIFSSLEKIPASSGAFPGRSKPIKDVTVHKYLNLYMAVQKSSNIYMATLADRIVKAMGEKWYRAKLAAIFGLGTKTGIELSGESIGVLPHPGSSGWSKATPYSLAMGYNLQTTALQMARAFCVIANGGFLPELSLVRTIERDNDILVDNTGKRHFRRVLAEEDVKDLTRALKFVTKMGGSGVKADILGYTEAGKSGTSMKLIDGAYSEKAHFASFVGFAPADTPRFVLYVGLDEPWVGHIAGRGFNHRGGTCAAPIFRNIGKRVLGFLGVAEDDPYGYPIHDPRGKPKEAHWSPEAEALVALYIKWNK